MVGAALAFVNSDRDRVWNLELFCGQFIDKCYGCGDGTCITDALNPQIGTCSCVAGDTGAHCENKIKPTVLDVYVPSVNEGMTPSCSYTYQSPVVEDQAKVEKTFQYGASLNNMAEGTSFDFVTNDLIKCNVKACDRRGVCSEKSSSPVSLVSGIIGYQGSSPWGWGYTVRLAIISWHSIFSFTQILVLILWFHPRWYPTTLCLPTDVLL